MKREEAIMQLKLLKCSPLIYGEYPEAIDMAIEALSADTVPYCSTREVSWSEPRTWHE